MARIRDFFVLWMCLISSSHGQLFVTGFNQPMTVTARAYQIQGKLIESPTDPSYNFFYQDEPKFNAKEPIQRYLLNNDQRRVKHTEFIRTKSTDYIVARNPSFPAEIIRKINQPTTSTKTTPILENRFKDDDIEDGNKLNYPEFPNNPYLNPQLLNKSKQEAKPRNVQIRPIISTTKFEPKNIITTTTNPYDYRNKTQNAGLKKLRQYLIEQPLDADVAAEKESYLSKQTSSTIVFPHNSKPAKVTTVPPRRSENLSSVNRPFQSKMPPNQDYFVNEPSNWNENRYTTKPPALTNLFPTSSNYERPQNEPVYVMPIDFGHQEPITNPPPNTNSHDSSIYFPNSGDRNVNNLNTNVNSLNSNGNSFNSNGNSFNTNENSVNTNLNTNDNFNNNDGGPNLINGIDESQMSASRKKRAAMIAESKCSEYRKLTKHDISAIALVPNPNPVSVSVSEKTCQAEPLVVGGKIVDIETFPHMAALGWKKVQTRGYAWKCGGSLVSDQFVLTAAHCTYQERDNSVYSGAPRVVLLGSSNLESSDAKIVPVKEAIRHPSYKPPVSYHDIALLKLSQRVQFTDRIRPACIGTPPPIGQKVTATGWGKTEYGDQSSQLLGVSLPVWGLTECGKALGSTRRLPNGPLEGVQMCAGDRKGGKDTCQGDSGGPAMIMESDCTWRIVGLTSFGRACGAPNTPAVYSIPNVYWVAATIWL